MNKKWLWLLAGYVLGSYLGLSHVLGMVGKKNG